MKHSIVYLAIIVLTSCKSAMKSDTALTNLYDKSWKMVELNHKPLVKPPRLPELIFKEDGTFSGNNGCNSIGGRYEFSEGNGIKFSNVFSTKRACIDNTLDMEFDKMLENSNRYKLKNDTLYLQVAAKTVSKFVVSK